MKRSLKLFLGGSAAALLAVLAVPKRESTSPLSSAPPGSALALAGAAEGLETSQLLSAQRERAEELTWSRDPFLLPAANPIGSSATSAIGQRGPRYQGLAIFDGRTLALVGPEIVGVGDQLASGHHVVSIEAHQLVLEREGRAEILPLTPAPAEQ